MFIVYLVLIYCVVWFKLLKLRKEVLFEFVKESVILLMVVFIYEGLVGLLGKMLR